MSKAFKRMAERGQKSTEVNTSGGGKKLKMANFCQVLEFAKEGNEDKPFRLRQITPWLQTCVYLVHLGKFHDKKGERPKRVPIISPSKIIDDDGFDSSIPDPYYQAHRDKILDMQFRFERWAAFIDRDAQMAEPGNQTAWTQFEEEEGVKEMSSQSWSPVYACRFTNKMVERLQALVKKNKHQTENGLEMCPLEDIYFGHDIEVTYTGRTPDYYVIDLPVEDPAYNIGGEVIPIKGALYEDEMQYLMPDIEEAIVKMQTAENEAQMEDNITRLADMYRKNMIESGRDPDQGQNGYGDEDTGSQDDGTTAEVQEVQVGRTRATAARAPARTTGRTVAKPAPGTGRKFGRDQSEQQVEEGEPEAEAQAEQEVEEVQEEQVAATAARSARQPARPIRRPAPRSAPAEEQVAEEQVEQEVEAEAEAAPAPTRTVGRPSRPARPAAARTATTGTAAAPRTGGSSFSNRFKRK